jgi:hypothetical protein
MNQRIRELVRQAGLDDADFPIENWDNVPLAKFAELIVQECIDIIAPYTVRMSRPGEEYLHPILEIKEHFGVKE